MTRSVYIHVPFCSSICPYCDFARTIKNEKWIEQWLVQIKKEIRTKLKNIDQIDTLYIGGGTPSVLSIEQFDSLMIDLIPYLSKQYEFTIECNPESLSKEKLKAYREHGVNRISLGVQSFDPNLLETLGRHHDPSRIENLIQTMKDQGINNISIDLMFALPNQGLKDVQRDLEQFFRLDIDHLSIYSLILEENSIFGKQNIHPVDEDLEADEYEQIVKTMKSHGYEHYEISSFARNKKYSKHNLVYWTDQEFTGIGCGASGRENGKRYTNTKNIRQYIEYGPQPVYEEIDAPFEMIMMGLRTSFGVDLEEMKRKYRIDLLEKGKEVIGQYKNDLQIVNRHLRCTETGMEKLNSILVDFLEVFK